MTEILVKVWEKLTWEQKAILDSVGLNLSTTDRGDTPKYPLPEFQEPHKRFNGLPSSESIIIPYAPYNGHVVISPDAGDAKQSENGENIPRAWFTFHELQESYNRTDLKLGYREAHRKANEQGRSFYLTPADWSQEVF
ncbi:MAG: hypothetical protein HC892_19685 [Saprospiraceae bacterium]|nr:hypothetical protein [Saprospiraceae bacterium]